MIFRVVRNAMRPRIYDAIVEAVFMQQYVHKNHASSKEFRHATVRFAYKSLDYKQDILLKSKNKIGDKIQLTVNSEQPIEVEQFYPSKEIMVAAIIEAIGIGFIITSFILVGYFD